MGLVAELLKEAINEPSRGMREAAEDTSSWLSVDPPPAAPCFVYVACDAGAGLYKVGISEDPDTRVRGLATGGSRRLAIVALLALPTSRSARLVEKGLHRALAASATSGEWFTKSERLTECVIEMEQRCPWGRVVALAHAVWQDQEVARAKRQSIRSALYVNAGSPERLDESIAGGLMRGFQGAEPNAAELLVGEASGATLMQVIARKADQDGCSFRDVAERVCQSFQIEHVGWLRHGQRKAVADLLGVDVTIEQPATVVVESVTKVKGWSLLSLRGESQPRIGQHDLAERLGVTVEAVAKTADSVLGTSWKLSTPSREFRTGTRGPQTREFLFDRRQTLELCVVSRGPHADRIRADVLDVYEAWLDGRLAPAPAPALDPTLAALFAGQNQIAGLLTGKIVDVEKQLAQKASAADLEVVKGEAAAAQRDAAEARALAEQAKTIAGARSVIDAVARATPAGSSSETPDGAWSAKPPPGYKSMRGVAKEYSLPSDGVGCGFVGKVARALGIYDDLHAVAYQDVVIGGRTRRQHVTYGPKALARLDAPLRAAHAAMVARGYHVRFGALVPAGVGPARRSKDFVLAEMFEAAAAGPRATAEQQNIPGVDASAAH